MRPPLVFLSHSSKDKDEAIRLTELLRQRGVEVWLDHEQIGFGDSILGKIEEGLKKCDAILVLVSESFTTSRWCRIEYEIVLTREIETGKTAVIPVRLDGAAVPELLKHKKYLDIRWHAHPKWVFDLGSLVQQIRARQADVVVERLPKERSYHCSLLSMIIGGVVRDFPVASMTDDSILQGHSLLALYQTVDQMVRMFQELADSLGAFIGRGETLANTNRRLIDIARDMRSLASSIEEILNANNPLRIRLEDVLNICVSISCIEGMVLVGFGFPPSVLDDLTDTAYGFPRYHFFDEWTSHGARRDPRNNKSLIDDYNKLAESLSSYRHQLREVIAVASSGRTDD